MVTNLVLDRRCSVQAQKSPLRPVQIGIVTTMKNGDMAMLLVDQTVKSAVALDSVVCPFVLS